MEISLTGIAAIITAVTGVCSLIISVYLIWRISRVDQTARHIEYLTNSNFSEMQTLLETAVETARESAERDRERQDKQGGETNGSDRDDRA